jgi:hypothetical protein
VSIYNVMIYIYIYIYICVCVCVFFTKLVAVFHKQVNLVCRTNVSHRQKCCCCSKFVQFPYLQNYLSAAAK